MNKKKTLDIIFLMADFGGLCEFSLKIHFSTGASGWLYVHSKISFIYIYFSCDFFPSLFVSFDLKIIEMMLYSLIESQALNIGYRHGHGHGNRIEVRCVLRDYDARIQMMIWTIHTETCIQTQNAHTHLYIESINERVLDRKATCTHIWHSSALHCTRAMHFKVHMCIHCTQHINQKCVLNRRAGYFDNHPICVYDDCPKDDDACMCESSEICRFSWCNDPFCFSIKY